MATEEQKTILLVEDESLIAEAEKMTLEKFGYKVMMENTGEKAVETVEACPDIDLILMDINLGSGIDGTETAVKILEKHDLPVVFLSSHTEREVVERTEGITSYGYIVKNSGDMVLAASVKMAFRLFDARMKEKVKEDALRESNEILGALFHSSPLAIIALDPDGTVTLWNPAAERMFGWQGHEAVGQFLPIVPEDKQDEHLALRERVLRGEAFVGVEVRRRKKDGSLIDISISTAPLYGPGGRVIGIISVSADITERKRAEESLRLSEQQFRLSLKHAPVTVAAQDRDLRFLWAYNQRTVNPEDVIGLTDRDIFIPEDADRLIAIKRRVLDTGMEANEKIWLTRHGERMYLDLYVEPIRDANGNIEGIGIATVDLTPIKVAESRLRESEERFQSFMDNSPAIAWMKDEEGRHVYLSRACEKRFGVTLADWKGKTDFEVWPNEIAEQFRKNDQAVLASGQSIEAVEETFLEGERRFWWNFKFPVQGANGRRYIGGIGVDITERKRAEERVQNLLREKELILKESHHRIKNNMNIIFSLLTIQAHAQKNQDAKMVLSDAAGRVQSMSVLYDKLYRSDNDNMLSVKDYLPSLVHEIVSLFPQKASVKTKYGLDDIALGSKMLSSLGIIINELITNTMKHAFAGRNEVIITILASKEGDCVSIIFGDNGCGIPESVTLENSSGFGLQLVGMLVKQMNGSVIIERRQGTRFIFEFKA